MSKFQAVVVGGGMITHDQILPSLYHLQRTGRDRRHSRLRLELGPAPRAGRVAEQFRAAFPGQGSTPLPGLDRAAGTDVPELFRQAMARRCRRGTWWWWPCPTISTTA